MDILTCSDEVQSSTASFIASQQLQTEANIPPTEIPLHSFVNPHFVQQNTGTMAVDQAHFPLVSDEEITEINETAASKNTARQGGLRNPTRRSPQQMWSTDGGERDPVKLFEEWLEHRPDVLKKSGPLYLTIISRPTSNTWYSKTRMGQHRIGQIVKSVASCLPPESNKITNHSTRKTVVSKLKNAGQPRHKIVQVTGHARESSSDDYDEITVSERRELSHIASGYMPAQSSSTSAISRHLFHQQVVSLRTVQFGACSFNNSISCMHEGERSTSSSNQFKPSFFINECGRIYRYAVLHLQHGH